MLCAVFASGPRILYAWVGGVGGSTGRSSDRIEHMRT